MLLFIINLLKIIIYNILQIEYIILFWQEKIFITKQLYEILLFNYLKKNNLKKMKKILFYVLIVIILILLVLLFFFSKKAVKITKEKEVIELPEKEKKIIEKSIKEKIIISKKKTEVIDYDIYMLKINPAGTLLWQKNINNKFVDWAEFAFQTEGNEIFLICRSYDIDKLQDKFYIIKTDTNGILLWQKEFDEFFSDEEKIYNTKYGYITIGRTWTSEKKDYVVYISATDNDGNYLWIKNFGNKYYEWGYFVLISKDDAYLIGEDIDYPGFNFDFYLKKKDMSGKILWLRSYGIGELNKGYAIISGLDNGYILTGVSYSFNDEKSTAYLLKADDDGNKIWENIFKGAGYNEIFSITKDENSKGYLLAGTTNSKGAGLYDVYLIRTDINGNKIWEKTFGSNGNDAAYHIFNCNDGNFIITGVTQK